MKTIKLLDRFAAALISSWEIRPLATSDSLITRTHVKYSTCLTLLLVFFWCSSALVYAKDYGANPSGKDNDNKTSSGIPFGLAQTPFEIGNWQYTSNNLPVYNYTGPLPFEQTDPSGDDVLLAKDPYFMLGNYRLTLFVHASGAYQFLTGERSWARINANPNEIDYGNNAARSTFLSDKNKKVDLVGLSSLATESVANC